MATIGSSLTSPESGWRRYNDTDTRIKYIGTGWGYNNYGSGTAFYGTDVSYSDVTTDKIFFKFYGTKLRIITQPHTTRSRNLIITIDNTIIENYSICTSPVDQRLNYEKTGLSLGVHTVEISNEDSLEFVWDAIDIDDTGYLVHPTLNQVSSLDNMQIGDCIPCRYTASSSGGAGTFWQLGTCVLSEIPSAGTDTPDGLFYFIKADKGLLIADRNVQTYVTWNTLNSAKYIEGVGMYSLGNFVSVITKGTQGAINISDTSILSTYSYGSHCGSWITFNIGSLITSPGDTVTLSGYLSYTNHYDSALGMYLDIYDNSSYTRETTYYYYVATGAYKAARMITTPIAFTVTLDYNGNFSGTWSGAVTNVNSFTLEVGSGEYGGTFVVKVSNLICTKNGKQVNINNPIGLIRSLSGGNSYLGTDGNYSLTDKSLGGWPSINEWDKYIVNSDLGGKITAGDNTIWHYQGVATWAMDTSQNSVKDLLGTTGNNTYRIIRGYKDSYGDLKRFNIAPSTTINTVIGFRPVLEYKETDSKLLTMYY